MRCRYHNVIYFNVNGHCWRMYILFNACDIVKTGMEFISIKHTACFDHMKNRPFFYHCQHFVLDVVQI